MSSSLHATRPRGPSRAFAATALALVVTAGTARGRSQEPPLPDLAAFTAQVKARLQTDAARQAGYVFTERRVEQKLDGSGRVRDERVEIFEVYPPLPGEDEPYRRLIAQDGKPVPPAKLAERDRDRQKKAERYARDLARQSARDYEEAKRAYDAAMRRRADDIDDIFNVFDVQMTGRARVDGHTTIAFTLTPRPGAKARTDSGRMMRHFTARAGIS